LLIVEMRMIRWMCGYTRMNRISNGVIRDLVKVAPTKIRGDVRGLISPKVKEGGDDQTRVFRENLKVIGLTKNIT